VDGVLVAANSCNRPIEDSGICIIPQETTIANGDSGKFGPCETPNFYIRAYVCMPCTGATDYIDYQGVYCRSTCVAGNYLFMDSTHKICADSSSCVLKLFAALSTDGFYKLTCGSCTAGAGQFVSGSFCLDSCQDYYGSPACTINRALGRCDFEFVSSDASSCQATCSTYIYSANNDKVCAQTCASGKFNRLDENTLALTCSVCGPPNKQLDVFCVDSCKAYFLAHCNPAVLALTDHTGECRRPIEQDGICIVGTYNPSMGDNDSDKMTGCTTPQRYLKDYVCVTCEGDDEFVDYLGLNCLRSCSEGSYIFVDRNIKICS